MPGVGSGAQLIEITALSEPEGGIPVAVVGQYAQGVNVAMLE